MKRAAAWSVRGVERETQEIVEEAARRAGMSLPDWLDEVVAAYAASRGVRIEDMSQDERLDAIANRISLLSMRESPRGEREEVSDRPAFRSEPARQIAPREGSERLEAVLARFEERAARNEERTAKALESVASLIEREKAERATESAKLAEVAQKLAALKEAPQRDPQPRTAPQSLPHAGAPSPTQIPTEEIDIRLSELAKRVDARTRELASARSRNSAPAERPKLDIRESLSQIARRQSALDARTGAATTRAPASSSQREPIKSAEAAKSVWRGFGVDAAPGTNSPSAPAPSQPSPALAPPAPTGPALETLRAEILSLNARLDRMRAEARAESNERRLTANDAEALRAELAAMTRSLADLAPRNGGVALEGAVGDLGQRLSAARQAGADEDILAPVEAKLREVVEALRKYDPQAAVGALERELHSLGGKVDALSSAVVKPQALNEILRQTEDIRNLLAAAASQSVPVERLEKQIGQLADCVERLADSPSPRVETERVLDMLADTRAQIERAIPPAVLNSIERRVEQLAYRIDEALNRPQPTPKLDVKPIEDLTRRIDQALSRPQPAAKLDVKPIEDLARRIDEALSRPQPAPKLDVKPIEDLTRRIDEALSRPRPAPMLDVKPIEDLARRVDSVRAALERQGDFRPQAAKLEAALADISLKLDRAPADAAIPHELNSTLQTLAARLEDAFRKPAPAPSPDAQPIEDLARRIEGVRASVESRADVRPDIAKLESALNELAAKIDRQAPAVEDSRALIDVIQDLADRIDRGASRVLDTAPIERLVNNLNARPVEVDTTPIQAMLLDLGDRIAANAANGLDAAAVESLLRRLETKLDTAEARPLEVDTAPIQQILHEIGDRVASQARAGFDPAPLEDILHRIDAKLDAVDSRPVEIDTGPIERMLAEFGERFSANSAATIDTAPIEHAIRDIRDRLDSIEAPAFDYRRIEDAADLIAQRLESRGGLNVDAEALVNQITEIHTRLDSLSSSSGSAAVLERAVGDLAAELDSIRALIKSAALDPAIPVALVDEIAGLKNEQANSDRRMAARLASVHDIVEKLAERLQEIEQDGPAAVAAERSIQEPVASSSATLSANRDLRDIPDRVGSAAKSASQAAASVAASPMGLSGANESTSFLLEPGAAAPRAKRAADDELPAAGKPNDIQAHIAAARRAAMAEMSSRRERGDTESNSQPSRIAQGLSALKQAQALVTGKRVPFLVGASLLVVAAAAAVIELRAPRAPAVQKSELPTTLQPPTAQLGAAETPPKSSAQVDFTPTGAIDASKPAAPAVALAVAPPPSGRPTSPDLVAALSDALPQALRDAAIAGDPGAETELGLRWLEGRSVSRDAKLAVRWLELAATQGAPVAQYRLAALYEKGIGVNKDTQLARAWYLKAANAGNARAMHNLAVLDAEDAGAGKPDYAEAASWFRRAGQLGIRDSQYNLGVLYGRGLGLPQDLGQSWLWFSLAAQQGDADAGKKRDEVASKMDPAVLAAASKALAEFKIQTPTAAANEAQAPAGGWDAKSGAPQAAHPSPAPTPAAHG